MKLRLSPGGRLAMVVVLALWGSWPCAAAEQGKFTPVNLARGKSYTWSQPPNYMHGGRKMCTDEGDAVQLTDGKRSQGFWWDPLMVGWGSFRFLDVIFDLERVAPIDRIVVRAASRPDAWMFPKSIQVYVSEDRKTWYHAGDWPGRREDLQTDRSNYRDLVIANLRTAGRYVALKFEENAFIDEVQIFNGPYDPATVSFAAKAPLRSLDLLVFFDRPTDRIYVARERFYPVPIAGGKTYDDFTVTVPAGVAVRRGKDVQPESQENPDGSVTFRLGKIEERTAWFYANAKLPVGRAGRMTLSANINEQRREKTVALQVVEVPEAPTPKRWITTATFVIGEFFLRWPGFADAWRRAGMSTVALHSWDLYRMPGRPDLREFPARMRKEGFFVAGNLSPFNPWPGLLEQYPDVHRWVTCGGETLEFPCPLGYAETKLQQELGAIQNGVKAGIGMFFLDSEPSLPSGGKGGQACFCERCTARFRKYLAEKYPDMEFVDPKTIVTADHPDPSLLRAWKESTWSIAVEIFGKIRKLVDQAPRSGPLRLGNYGTYEDDPVRNFHNLRVMVEAGVFDHSAPSQYGRTPDKVGDAVADTIWHSSVPCLPWISTGLGPGGEHYPRAMLRPLFYETLVNGAAGYLIFTPLMMTALDYREHALAIRALAPVESLICEGHPVSRDAVGSEDPDIRVAGSWNEGSYVLLISRGKWVERRTYEKVYTGEVVPIWEADYEGRLPEASYEINAPVPTDMAVIDLELGEQIGEAPKARDGFSITLGPKHPYRLVAIVPKDEAARYLGR